MKKNSLCRRVVLILVFISTLALPQPDSGPFSGSESPFWPNGAYLEGIATPLEILGFNPGTQPIEQNELEHYLAVLSTQSGRVLLREAGKSWENRKIEYLVISSEENLSRLPAIRHAIAQLADPRQVPDAQAREIIAEMPAIAWMAYNIHGNESSSTEAAVQLAYQLAAGSDSTTRYLLDHLVIILYPLQNPDGRARALQYWRQWRGPIPNSDPQSLHHSGGWPGGRGNHYLFDLNRDFLPLTQPETRAHVQAVNEWHPQLFVDSHEMGGLDTYLFSPPREPIHPRVPAKIRDLWKLFSRDQARWYNRYGWRYYTRDWHEQFYPGYADAWILFGGCVGILYEQARVEGSQIKQLDGHILTYREAVHHHFISSMSNLITAAQNRRVLLETFHAARRAPLQAYARLTHKALAIDATRHPQRAVELIERLRLVGLEIHQTTEAVHGTSGRDYWGRPAPATLPAGSYIVDMNQPLAALAQAFCDFDPHMLTSTLQEERKSLEKRGESRIYDVTAWSLPIAYGVDAWWLNQSPVGKATRLEQIKTVAPNLQRMDAPYACLIPYQQARAAHAGLELLQRGYTVYAADKPFRINGTDYAAGTLVLFASKNPADLPAVLEKLAARLQVEIHTTATGLVEEGLDFGSSHYALLKTPRIAVVANTPVSSTNMGAIWFLVEQELGARYSLLDMQRLGNLQLDLYNVLVLPSLWGDPGQVKNLLGKNGIERLKRWIEEGGTLIAMGSAAVFAADSSLKWSQVRPRAQVLDQLGAYQSAAHRQRRAEKPVIDSLALWAQTPTSVDSTFFSSLPKKPAAAELKTAQEQDKWLSRFLPSGAILRAELDAEHFLNFGLDPRIPVYIENTTPLLAREPVQVTARLATAAQLRLSGLLWPEGRELLAESVYCSREKVGRGQLILFAGDPFFRAYYKDTAQMLINAMLLGPGMGTTAELQW